MDSADVKFVADELRKQRDVAEGRVLNLERLVGILAQERAGGHAFIPDNEIPPCTLLTRDTEDGEPGWRIRTTPVARAGQFPLVKPRGERISEREAIERFEDEG